MKSFRDCTVRVRTSDLLQRAEMALRRADWLELLVEAGELEQAIVDGLNPRRDRSGPVEQRLRDLSLTCAAAYSGSIVARACCRRTLSAMRRLDLPAEVTVRAPEGYMHYALSPDAYREMALRYVTEVDCLRAAGALVIGVRTIGTSLSAVVADAIGAGESITLRPRGISGERFIAADRELTGHVSRWSRNDADVLVVDEGPGATGETFEVINRWLLSLGIPQNRIVFFCSHDGGFAMAPEARRSWFKSTRTLSPPVENGRIENIADRFGLEVVRDLSGGQWRRYVPGGEDLAACPSHERRKILVRDGTGRSYVMRYAGLGKWGTATADRAEQLARAGLGPAVIAYEDGFLILEWIDGSPAFSVSQEEVLRELPCYIARRAGLFSLGYAVDREPILEALLENAREALGNDVPVAAAAKRIEILPDREAVIADARLNPWEWIRTGAGLRKLDALDHGDGIRLPGPTDAAWDVAAYAIEYQPDETHLEALVTGCSSRWGHDRDTFAMAVSAYRPVCAAVALGEAELASREAGNEADRRRLLALRDRYSLALHGALLAYQNA